MDTIKKKYVLDENQNKIAVQIDIAEYNKIEKILEDYALGKLMEENDPLESMSLSEARVAYAQLIKEKSNENSG